MKIIFSRLQPLIFLLHHRWKLSLIVLVLLGAGFLLYRRTTANQPELTFAHPEYRELVSSLDVSGVVDAREKARLRFAAGGKVVYLGAKEGDTVRRGQTLATIDRATLQKQLQQSLNAYQRERNSWDQLEEDQDEVTMDNQDRRTRDSSQLRLNDTVLSVEQQSIAIQNTVLAAPFGGILTFSPTTVPGITLLPTDYFEVVNPSSIYFKAAIDEADIAKIRTGQQAQLLLDAFPDTPLQATVERIAFTSSESSTGTVFVVDFSLAEHSLPLRLGMNGDIAIELDRRPRALAIPLTTTRERDGQVFVDVRTGENSFAERKITTGLSTDDWVEVLSGLQETDEVLIPF